MVGSILNPGPSRGSGVFPPQPRNIWKQKSLNLRFPAITIPLGILKCSGKAAAPQPAVLWADLKGFIPFVVRENPLLGENLTVLT